MILFVASSSPLGMVFPFLFEKTEVEAVGSGELNI